MTNKKKQINIGNLDIVVKKIIAVIDNSKDQILDIAENARKEVKRLKQEFKNLKDELKEIFATIENLEKELKESRRRLALLSKKFNNRSEKQLKDAYEQADKLRIDLAVKREQEHNYIIRRNEIEIRLKETLKTIEKAENLMAQVDVAMGYLKGDLLDITSHLGNIQQKQNFGMKIIQAQEEERQRVARDIHDGPAQSMSNVVLKAEICEKLLDVDIEKSRNELKELKRVVRGCLQDVRRIIYDLRPMSLDDLGLVPTIQRYVSNYQEETDLSVNFLANGDHEELSSTISLTTFRILQESLNNVKKHAEATHVVIHLSIGADKLMMGIYDDGRGFDIDNTRIKDGDTSSGFGLDSMKERIELLGGTFKIQSTLGKGTRLNIAIPLSSEKEEQNGENQGINR